MAQRAIDGAAQPAQASDMAGNQPPALSGFARAADELRQQEFARLMDAVTPRIEALRSMTPAAFRNEIAMMLERLGHTLITDPAASELVSTKEGRKFITACANSADPAPTMIPALQRLHDRIVAASAAAGFYVTARTFTDQAHQYAETAPIHLVDGELLTRSMNRSKKGVRLPQIYKAMCRQCGDVIQHRLDQARALPCGNGHLVAPTIARAALVPRRQPPPPAAVTAKPAYAPKWRNNSPKAKIKRQMRAHNHEVRARALRQQRDA
jgi:restriction endonuclease